MSKDTVQCTGMQAWKRVMPVAEPFREFADRWGNDDFGQYCQLLQQHADCALQQADQVIIYHSKTHACDTGHECLTPNRSKTHDATETMHASRLLLQDMLMRER